MLKVGDRFGDYTVERLLGKGGMGAVYLLKTAEGGQVAAKILDPAMADDHESRKRFLREAELALGVKHPNLVETYDVGEDPDTGICYILMEYVSGGSLADRLDEGPLPINDAIRIVYQIASVLELAREKGIVHRDIKPANIMFGADGKAKLADLGIARGDVGGANVTTVTQTGMMIGTPAYMAPEQMLDAHHVDSRADIYSLGIVFYEMLAGERPHPNDTVVQLMAKAVAGEPIPDVRTMRPEVSAAVAELISLMCAMKVDERVATPREVTTALSQIAHGREVTIRRKAPMAISKSDRARGWGKTLVAGGILSTAVAVAVGAWCLVGENAESQAPMPVSPPTPQPARVTFVTNAIVKTVEKTVPGQIVPPQPEASTWKPQVVDTGLPKKILELGDGVPPLEFVGCPAGTCEFGRTHFFGQWDKCCRIPPHKVIITRPFWIGRLPLTFEQWAAFSPPIELTAEERLLGGVKGALGRVSQDEILAACARLTDRFRSQLPPGHVVRLPTEAEFGYACLAGSAVKEDPYASRESPARDLVGGWSRIKVNRTALKNAGMTVPAEWMTPQGVVKAEHPNRWGLGGMRAYHHVFDRLPPLTKEEIRFWGRDTLRSAMFERLFSGPNQYAAVRTDPLFWYEGEAVPAALVTCGRETHDLHPATRNKTYDLVRLVIGPDLLKERGLRPPKPSGEKRGNTGVTDRRVRFAEANGMTWYYTLENGSAVIWRGQNGYNNETRPAVRPEPSGEVEVPACLDGHRVRAIGCLAFFRCRRMTSVSLPEGLEELRGWSFMDCDALTEVVVPKSLKAMKANAFCSCRALKSIDIGLCSNVRGSTFWNCSSLGEVRVAPGNTAYVVGGGLLLARNSPTLVFYSRTRQDVAWPRNLKEIGEGAFLNCPLTDVEIPDSVEKIGANAFFNCHSLRRIAFGSGLREVGSNAFRLCRSLERLDFPSSLSKLGNGFADGCRSLKLISFGGDAPEVDASKSAVIGTVPESAEIVVNRESKGWNGKGGAGLPSTWPPGNFEDARPIRYRRADDAPSASRRVARPEQATGPNGGVVQDFDWEKWFSDGVPMGAELLALPKNNERLARAAIEEKIGRLKAVREELKAAFDDVAGAKSAYAGGQAVAKLGRLVTKYQKLKTSPTGRSRLQRWEEQAEVVNVAEARSKLLEWLLFVKVEDGPSRTALMKALDAAQRDLKTQLPKLEKLKKQAGVEF